MVIVESTGNCKTWLYNLSVRKQPICLIARRDFELKELSVRRKATTTVQETENKWGLEQDDWLQISVTEILLKVTLNTITLTLAISEVKPGAHSYIMCTRYEIPIPKASKWNGKPQIYFGNVSSLTIRMEKQIHGFCFSKHQYVSKPDFFLDTRENEIKWDFQPMIVIIIIYLCPSQSKRNKVRFSSNDCHNYYTSLSISVKTK